MNPRVYWGSRLFVYWVQDHPDYAPRIERLRNWMLARQATICTSAITLEALLEGAYRQQDEALAAEIRTRMRPPAIEVLALTGDIADRAARLRAQHRVSSTFALHLASAASVGVDLYVTTEPTLYRLVVPGIRLIAPLDAALF